MFQTLPDPSNFQIHPTFRFIQLSTPPSLPHFHPLPFLTSTPLPFLTSTPLPFLTMSLNSSLAELLKKYSFGQIMSGLGALMQRAEQDVDSPMPSFCSSLMSELGAHMQRAEQDYLSGDTPVQKSAPAEEKSKPVSRMKKAELIAYLAEKNEWDATYLKTFTVKELKEFHKTGELPDPEPEPEEELTESEKLRKQSPSKMKKGELITGLVTLEISDAEDLQTYTVKELRAAWKSGKLPVEERDARLAAKEAKKEERAKKMEAEKEDAKSKAAEMLAEMNEPQQDATDAEEEQDAEEEEEQDAADAEEEESSSSEESEESSSSESEELEE